MSTLPHQTTSTAPAAPSSAGANAATLDVGAVTAWVAGLDLDACPPLHFDRFGHGQSNLTFLVSDANGGRWVLRRPPRGLLLASAHDVVREHRILSALEPTDVPTPAVLGLSTDARVSDVPLMLMEHVDGLVVDEMPMAERLTPRLRGQIGDTLPETLALVHAVDLDGAGLTGLASHGSYAARQLKRWTSQWERSKTRELPAIDDLARRLVAAMPEQREVTLVHGDYHLRNLIVDPGDGGARAVLDWELCTLGDPLADLGALLAYWPHASDPAPAAFPAPTLPGFPSREELAAAYAARTGRGLSALGFWHVLGLWKVAIISEGVLRRTSDEPENAVDGLTPTIADVDDVVTRALFIADAEGL